MSNINKTENENSQQEKKSFLESFFQIMNWIQIVASPFLISCLLAFSFYIYQPNNMGIVVSIIIVSAGLVAGIIWAKRIKKKIGAEDYISKISASPDFDKIDKE